MNNQEEESPEKGSGAKINNSTGQNSIAFSYDTDNNGNSIKTIDEEKLTDEEKKEGFAYGLKKDEDDDSV